MLSPFTICSSFRGQYEILVTAQTDGKQCRAGPGTFLERAGASEVWQHGEGAVPACTPPSDACGRDRAELQGLLRKDSQAHLSQGMKHID